MQETRKDRAASEAVENAIRNMFADAVDRIVVGPSEGPDREPSLFVTLYRKAAQRRMSGRRLLDMIAEASTALRDVEDDRFPFVTFLAAARFAGRSRAV